MRAGYFNNYYIRFLLGRDEGAKIPWDGVTEDHFNKAKRILEAFDLVVPIDFLADALPSLQCALGPRYDVGLDGTHAGRFGWTNTRKTTNTETAECNYGRLANWHERTKAELCLLFLKHNIWDRKLYNWALRRWRDWDGGRCRSAPL